MNNIGNNSNGVLSHDGQRIAEGSREVIQALKNLYMTKMRPLEKKFMFDIFHSPLLSEADFDSKPQVLMIGQYSVGKTSFIEYLLGSSFPGQRIGPEPTTDRFVAVMHGNEERIIPGNAITVTPDLPYTGLSMFGTSFLNKFEASQMPNAILENITIVDTPGILSGEKQRISRGYDFVHVARWFAERSDMILLLFDAHKLDISDEFQRVIEVLKGHDDKVRCVLNKADQIDEQKLMRVYGALMWSMGKVMKTPEVMRVFIGSFWDEPMLHKQNASLFEAEESDLMSELRTLPQNAAVRKINELVKRARLAKVHARLIGHIKDKMPTMMGKEKKQREIIADMGSIFREVQSKYKLPPGDFPDLEEFTAHCKELKFDKFPVLKVKYMQELDDILSKDIPKMMERLPKRERSGSVTSTADVCLNPFAAEDVWEVANKKPEYDAIFKTLRIDATGKASGPVCMEPMKHTGCPKDQLRAIWDLADLDKDGHLDADEFAVAMYLCNKSKEGEVLPAELPSTMVPPSKSNMHSSSTISITGE